MNKIEKLKFFKYINNFNKQCDLLDIIPILSFLDLYYFYEIGWDAGFLARSLEI